MPSLRTLSLFQILTLIFALAVALTLTLTLTLILAQTGARAVRPARATGRLHALRAGT